ncbi:MAG: V-type ATPase subunit [Corallococcus sp.]|nr:V-type ATPase subunit [Corallococcus sp.]MCM1359385.1 V-type ATPase subunit [Corallococcus sp.]MCM1394828.1 V-type ATPase subunit [Corallococcus sp.]
MNNQIYANGRISVLSTKLLGQDKFSRLAECNYVAEALKVLSECGYRVGENAVGNDYVAVLTAETDAALSSFSELCCDKHALDYFLCKYRYHNAKVLMKRKYMRVDGTDGCFDGVGIAPALLQQAFVSDDYSSCTKNMAEACDKIDTAFAEGNRSPQVIDKFLDKAMFEDMSVYAKKSGVPLVRKLFDWHVDTVNMTLIYRLKKAALTKEQFDEWYIPYGSVKKEQLDKMWQDEKASGGLSDECKKFFALCGLDKESLSEAEAEQKNWRNKLVDDAADLLSIQPAIKYFFAKTDEIDKVRSLLIGIKNGADKEKIKNSVM